MRGSVNAGMRHLGWCSEVDPAFTHQLQQTRDHRLFSSPYGRIPSLWALLSPFRGISYLVWHTQRSILPLDISFSFTKNTSSSAAMQMGDPSLRHILGTSPKQNIFKYAGTRIGKNTRGHGQYALKNSVQYHHIVKDAPNKFGITSTNAQVSMSDAHRKTLFNTTVWCNMRHQVRYHCHEVRQSGSLHRCPLGTYTEGQCSTPDTEQDEPIWSGITGTNVLMGKCTSVHLQHEWMDSIQHFRTVLGES